MSNQPQDKPTQRTIVHSMDEVPAFANDPEERAYWETHELAASLFERRPPEPEEAALLDRARRRRAERARSAS
jgi:hypothetical protein